MPAVIPELSVVIPALNEARRLGPTLERIRAHAAALGERWEVIVVDDGSTDDTARFAERYDAGALSLRVLRNERNRGKGYSVKRGMLEATGGQRLVTDADLSAPIEEIDKLRPWLTLGFDIAIGSRDMPDSELRPAQPLRRRIMGVAFREVRRAIILRQLRDTQCGFKLFTAAAAATVFPEQTAGGYAFDCEVLALADKHGLRVKEVGVVWGNDLDSRVRPVRDSLQMLGDLLRIRWRLR